MSSGIAVTFVCVRNRSCNSNTFHNSSELLLYSQMIKNPITWCWNEPSDLTCSLNDHVGDSQVHLSRMFAHG